MFAFKYDAPIFSKDRKSLLSKTPTKHARTDSGAKNFGNRNSKNWQTGVGTSANFRPEDMYIR